MLDKKEQVYATWIGFQRVTHIGTNFRVLQWIVPDWSSGRGSYTNRADMMWFSTPYSNMSPYAMRNVAEMVEGVGMVYESDARPALYN